MAVDFTELFTRMGLSGGTYNAINTFRGTTIPGQVDGIIAEYADPDLNLLDGIWQALSAFQQTPTGWMQYLQTLAGNTLTQMVEADTPLNQVSLYPAIAELIRQMVTGSQSLQVPTVTAGSASYGASNRGNGVLVATVTDAVPALMVSAFAETMSLLCTSDASTGATNYNEPFDLTTPAAVDAQSWEWPAGSGVATTLNSVNPQVDNSQGNLLVNSDFETFVVNAPSNWLITTGAAGSDILAGGSGNAYYGANCLQFKQFSGSPLSTIRQPFNNASAGTSYSLLPNTCYAFTFWMKRETGLTGAGTIRIALVNTATGAILTDDASNSLSQTYTALGLTTSYVAKTFVFRTPRALPAAGVSLQVGLSVAIADSGLSVWIDYGGMTNMTRLYAGGPLVALFSGSSPWAYGDTATLAIANNYGGAWVLLLERWFSLRQNGLQFPTSGSPTIADNLIA
jgi:hypothetical protein